MKKSAKKIVVILLTLSLVFALAVSLTACKKEEEVKEPLSEIRIGILNESSGILSGWGLEDYRGIMAGFEAFTTKDGETMTISGHPVTLIIEDTACDAQQAVSKATKLIEDDNVDLIIGTVSSGLAAQVMTVAAEYEIPYVITGAAADDITGAWFNPYTFRMDRTLSMASVAGMGVAEEIEGTTWAILSPYSVAGEAGAEALQAALEAQGAEVILKVFPDPAAMDFSAEINQIKAAAPDFLTATLTGDNYTVILPRQLKEMGVFEKTKLVCSVADFAMLNGLGEDAIGMIGECIYHYALYDNPTNTLFIETHEALYGTKPDYFSGPAFTGAQAVVLTLEKIFADGKELNTENFIATMEGLSFEAIKGDVQVRAADHQLLQTMAIAEVISDGSGGLTTRMFRNMTLEEMTFPVTAPGR